MALVVFDRGTRIKTPVSSIFPSRRIEASSASVADAAIPSGPDSPRAEYEQQITDFAHLAERAEHKEAANAYKTTADAGRTERPIITAGQIMSSPVISCSGDSAVAAALEQMTVAGVQYLAVFDNENELTGIISRQALLLNPRLAAERVDTAMQQHYLAATPDTSVIQIASNLLEYHCGAVLVLDEKDQLNGIITRTDLIRLLISQAHVEGWA